MMNSEEWEKLKNNYEILIEKIEKNAAISGRKKEDIEIVAATKGVPSYKIEMAIDLGIKIIGENRVQEAEKKINEVKRDAEWHMIGNLQRNKVKKAIKIFKMIQSVDSLKIAEEINKRVSDKYPVLIEVNTSFEETKHGFLMDELIRDFEKILSFKNLKILGLFTLGPYPVVEKKSREAFKNLRELKERIEKEYNLNLPYLSMGMSEDFEYAIQEGANMIRIGRFLFGEREK
jgi:pyridoxal phosphate enzyme (YggS family)